METKYAELEDFFCSVFGTKTLNTKNKVSWSSFKRVYSMKKILLCYVMGVLFSYLQFNAFDAKQTALINQIQFGS